MAVAVALGITLVTLLKDEGFSLFHTGLCAVVTFAVDLLFTYFEKKKK